MNTVLNATDDAAGYVEIVEEPVIREAVTRMRELEMGDQARVFALAEAMGSGSLSVAEANEALSNGGDAVRAMADRLAA